MTPTTQTHPDVHPGTPSVPPNPPTVPGSVPPSRACPGEAERSRAEPRGRDGQRPGRGALQQPANPVAPHEPPRGLSLFLRELALGLLDLFYPPRHP